DEMPGETLVLGRAAEDTDIRAVEDGYRRDARRVGNHRDVPLELASDLLLQIAAARTRSEQERRIAAAEDPRHAARLRLGQQVFLLQVAEQRQHLDRRRLVEVGSPVIRREQLAAEAEDDRVDGRGVEDERERRVPANPPDAARLLLQLIPRP